MYVFEKGIILISRQTIAEEDDLLSSGNWDTEVGSGVSCRLGRSPF